MPIAAIRRRGRFDALVRPAIVDIDIFMIDVLWISASISLLLMPPIALAVSLFLQKNYPNAQSKWALASAGMIVATILAILFRVSFKWGVANVIWLLGCYLAYCLVVASCLQLRKRLLRWLALPILAVPIALGYVIATIGSLGLGFIFFDAIAEPEYSQNEADGLTCSVTGWGGPIADTGYKGSLFQSWFGAPFLQREVAWINVNLSADIVARSDKADLPTPIHAKDYCTQLLSVRKSQS